MKAIRIHNFGGHECLRCEDIPLPEPGRDEIRIRLDAAGVNFIDIYHRTGQYPVELPATPGMEGAGTVDAVGPGVENLKAGDRAAYGMQFGSYAEYAVLPAWKAVRLPDDIGPDRAAAAMLQGMTAHYLSHDAYALKNGDTALVHAAAGGVGQLLVQMAKLLGARVIGTVSTEEKAALAKEAGADDIIFYTRGDFEAETRRLMDGAGVDVVYDSVGKTTFEKSLNCLKPRGYLVLYGQSSGAVPPFDPQVLNEKGSLFLTRPSLGHYAADTDELSRRSRDLFKWMREGLLKVRIDRTFPLEKAGEAHQYLEARQTKGKVLLLTPVKS
jgi:NADPH2:quinone reductase